jgi:hypothetical protein
VGDLFFKDPDQIYRALPLLEFDWLEHGFGTRLSPQWNDRADLILLNQVHSDCAVYADGRRAGHIGKGDALFTGVPGALIGVRTADCVPILIVDVEARAIAAVHAGWRGAAQGIAGKAVAEMTARFGSLPEDLCAAIGPAIGPCCYEVGPEVTALFTESNGLAGGSRLDLPGVNRRQLLDAGLLPGEVWSAGLCTACLADEFFSWRRDRHESGRMVSAIRITPPA